MTTDPMIARGIRVAIVLPLVLLVCVVGLGLGAAGLMGVFAVSALLIIGDFRGRPAARAATLLAISAGGAVMLVLGALAGQSEVTAVGGSAVVGFAVLLTGVYRGQFGRAGIPLLLPFLSAAANPQSWAALAPSMTGWLVGCAISSAGALLILPGYVRDTTFPLLADAVSAAADLVPQLWPVVTDQADPAYSRFAQAMAALDDHWQGDRSRPGRLFARERAVISIMDYLHRLQTLFVTRIQTGSGLAAADPGLATEMTQTLTSVAESLRTGAPQVTLSGLVARRDEQWHELTGDFDRAVTESDPHYARTVASRNFLLRMVSLLTVGLAEQTEAALGRPPRDDLSPGGMVQLPEWRSTPLRLLGQQLQPSSPWFRNAARGAFALAVAVALARIPQIAHGFWLVMGAIGALRFDAWGTGRTVRSAVVGQIAGFAVATGIVVLLHPYPVVLALLVPVAGFLSGVAPPSRLWMPQAAFTIQVVLCMTLLVPFESDVPMTRLLDISLGLAVSLLASLLLWPRGIQAHVAARIVVAAEAAAALVTAANQRVLGVGGPSFSEAADTARMAIRSASEAVDIAGLEQPPQPLPTMSWTRLVMTSRHLFFGSAVLSSAPPVDAPAAVADPLDNAAALAAGRFLTAERSVLGALTLNPGVDPGFTTTASALTDRPRPEVTALGKAASDAAVAAAAAGEVPISVVNMAEWDAMWLEHVELAAGHLENRRARIDAGST